ncbi:DUF6585 family protein [Roseateles sp. BYS87W]|uniref:DUF6585 family protein n=1 Tax=Pelomonas baiyunensis TaxID=3299026 RepID=A0ABW7GZ07_9BURK
MKHYLWLKVIAGLIGLSALLYGIHILDADPTLRVMQQVSMADIEAGRVPRDGQKVTVTDVWLLPTWVVETSHSRKRGDHAHVHVAVGSRAAFEAAAAGQPVDIKLWMRLPQDFRTREGATAAMNAQDLYGRPQAHEGVFNELPQRVREQFTADSPWRSQASMRLEEGATPSSAGDGAGFLAAGVLVLALVGAWLAADRLTEQWLRGVQAAGESAFQGTSPWLLGFGLALLVAPMLVFHDAGTWVDEHELDVALVGGLAALLALAAFSLWRNRVGWLVTPEGLVRAGRAGRQLLVKWTEVQALTLAERHFRGNVAVTYTLLAGPRKVKLGDGLFVGGVAQQAALGQALREAVNAQVAPALLQRLERGERVAFGALGAHRDGLVKGKLETGELLPWAEIESTTLKQGKLRIKRRGKLLAWENLALGKLHNPDVLLNLIQHHGPAAA